MSFYKHTVMLPFMSQNRMKQLKHLYFLLGMLFVAGTLLAATNHWAIRVNSLTNDAIEQPSNILCPTPTPLVSPTPVPLAARAETTSASSPCSYLPVVQHNKSFGICPTITPEAVPTAIVSPTPVSQTVSNRDVMNPSCVTVTPWPTAVIPTPLP